MGRKKLLENRSALILAAASRLFSEHGYQKTTLDEIAMQEGISKGSIYLEFQSKEEILFTLLLQTKSVQLTAMNKMAARTDKPALVLLKALLIQNIGDVFDSVKRNRLSPKALQDSRERLRAHLKPFFEARLQLIEALLRRAETQAEIAPQQDARRVAQLLMSGLRGSLPPYEPTTRKIKLQHDAAELLELFFNGLRAGR